MPNAAAMIGPHTCERCFDVATGYVRDARCTGWARTNDEGPYFLRWEPDGPVRYLCNRHMRKARELDKDMIVRQFAEAHPELIQEVDPALAAQLKAPVDGAGLL